MTAQQIFRMRNPALLMALAAIFPVCSYAASVANVDFSVGSVTAVDTVGVQRPLTRGAEIGNGDTIRTGEGGRAQVRFSDGAMVSLQPQTEFRIDNYQYSGKDDGQEKGFFSLLKGGLRTITGLIGRSNRDNYRVTTTVATIGIRGTEWVGSLNGEDLDVATGEGSVIVCNDQGCVILGSGESGGVSGHGRPHRRHTHPRLPPAQILEDVRPVFSSGDLGLPHALLTGTQTYATVYAHVDFSAPCCGPGSFSDKAIGTGTIDPNGTLSSFTSAEGVLGANVAGGNKIPVGDGFQGNDNIVAWGRWIDTSGAGFTGLGASEGAILHYVTGIPTADSDLAALSGTSASYSLIGGGVTGSSVGAGTINSVTTSMTVNFTLLQVTALNIGMTLPSGIYNLNSISPIGISSATGGLFSDLGVPVTGSGCLPSGCSAASVHGAFFGAGAARAGVSFGFSDGIQQVGGAVALKKGP